MGATEEAGKVVGGFMEAMKSQPLSLALVIMNAGLMGLMYLIWTTSVQSDTRQMEMIFSSQKDMQILLSKCVVPDGR